jgi:hypothetical protein
VHRKLYSPTSLTYLIRTTTNKSGKQSRFVPAAANPACELLCVTQNVCALQVATRTTAWGSLVEPAIERWLMLTKNRSARLSVVRLNV